ncbi:MAG: ATP-binding protein, partial [Meiothermus silvanus]|nr:ATP-binding protein [Allomeiothermus silvanus]
MVLGSREAGALDFWVAVEEGQWVRLDDLVYVEFAHPDPAVGVVRYYGMVDQVVKLYEGSQFDTDVFLAQRELLPVSKSYAAHVKVTRLEPEEYLPPDPGSRVYLAQAEALEQALYYDRMGNQKGSTRLPAGLLKNGEVAYVNLEFVNGVKGGHVNVSGISGVATKTSYALFLLFSLFHSGVLPEAANARAVVFNVKGEDLLHLDRPNNRLTPLQREAYHRLGLEAGPFRSVTF